MKNEEKLVQAINRELAIVHTAMTDMAANQGVRWMLTVSLSQHLRTALAAATELESITIDQAIKERGGIK
jgi:hypothetical protein